MMRVNGLTQSLPAQFVGKGARTALAAASLRPCDVQASLEILYNTTLSCPPTLGHILCRVWQQIGISGTRKSVPMRCVPGTLSEHRLVISQCSRCRTGPSLAGSGGVRRMCGWGQGAENGVRMRRGVR